VVLSGYSGFLHH